MFQSQVLRKKQSFEINLMFEKGATKKLLPRNLIINQLKPTEKPIGFVRRKSHREFKLLKKK